MCGQEILKLKKPLMALMIPLTAFLAAFIGFSIALLMPFQTELTVLRTALNTFEMVL